MPESDAKNEAPKKMMKKAAKPRAPRVKKTRAAADTPAAVNYKALVDAPAKQVDSKLRVTFAAEGARVAPPKSRISSEERERRISERAFSKAMRRGFRAGSPRADWLEAEREIDAEL